MIGVQELLWVTFERKWVRGSLIGIDGLRAVEAVWDEVEEAEGSPLASGALRALASGAQ